MFGAGDFRAVLRGTGHKIQRLSLARIYGEVAKDGDSPEVAADYVRLWDWGLFTFMNYGNDQSNPKWVALRKVEPKDAYSHVPNQAYYEQRLGKAMRTSTTATGEDRPGGHGTEGAALGLGVGHGCNRDLLHVAEQERDEYEQVVLRGLHTVKALALHVNVPDLVLVE